ncbi:MAG: hypothetical protein NTU81_02155 [Candidatus Nomurabacteria bacterium]|nr:hypothetical protein [Candidatus Nomurabacteria bacterium]
MNKIYKNLKYITFVLAILVGFSSNINKAFAIDISHDITYTVGANIVLVEVADAGTVDTPITNLFWHSDVPTPPAINLNVTNKLVRVQWTPNFATTSCACTYQDGANTKSCGNSGAAQANTTFSANYWLSYTSPNYIDYTTVPSTINSTNPLLPKYTDQNFPRFSVPQNTVFNVSCTDI